MSLSGNAISSYMVGVTRRRSKILQNRGVAGKIMLCTGRFLLSLGSTDGASTPSSRRGPRPRSVRTHASDSVGQSSGSATGNRSPSAQKQPLDEREGLNLLEILHSYLLGEAGDIDHDGRAVEDVERELV